MLFYSISIDQHTLYAECSTLNNVNRSTQLFSPVFFSPLIVKTQTVVIG